MSPGSSICLYTSFNLWAETENCFTFTSEANTTTIFCMCAFAHSGFTHLEAIDLSLIITRMTKIV